MVSLLLITNNELVGPIFFSIYLNQSYKARNASSLQERASVRQQKSAIRAKNIWLVYYKSRPSRRKKWDYFVLHFGSRNIKKTQLPSKDGNCVSTSAVISSDESPFFFTRPRSSKFVFKSLYCEGKLLCESLYRTTIVLSRVFVSKKVSWKKYRYSLQWWNQKIIIQYAFPQTSDQDGQWTEGRYARKKAASRYHESKR